MTNIHSFNTYIALCCLSAVIHFKHLKFVMRGVCTSRKKQWPEPGIEELGMFQLSSIHQCHNILYSTFITGLFLNIEDKHFFMG